MKQKKMGAVPEQQISPKQPMTWDESKKDIQTYINASEQKRSADRVQILNDQILQKVLTLERQQMGNTDRAQPLKKIAVIKKAQRTLNKTRKADPTAELFVQDFMPLRTDKSGKYDNKFENEAINGVYYNDEWKAVNFDCISLQLNIYFEDL